MALNLDVIGKKSDPFPFTYDEYRVILYALGIGAGTEELDFVYEKNLKVFPTFAVTPYMQPLYDLMEAAKVNMYFAVHGEQKITLHGPIPISGTLYSTAVLTSVYDKGDNGAVLNFEVSGKDEKGRPLFDNKFVCVDRRAGNFGGERGPKFEKLEPPEGKEPDFQVDYATSLDQGALYRLSGDLNPLHIEPDFAAKGGFDRPILHGLCTYGFTGRAILHSVCGSDPGRFKSFSARFMGVVFPGDTLTIKGWKMDDGKYTVQTTTQDGRVVLGNSLAEID